MHTSRCAQIRDSQTGAEDAWAVSTKKRFRANILVWGLPKALNTLEIRSKFVDLGLASFVRGNVRWEGDHVRLVLTANDSKGLTKALVSKVSSSIRKIGCRCVLDEQVRDQVSPKPVPIECVNRYEHLASCGDELMDLSSDEDSDACSGLDVNMVGSRVKALGEHKKDRRLRVATWNFSGLGSERKQKEVGELLDRNNIDVVAGQESWEKEDTRIDVEGYKWFGKPRVSQNSQRGEGGVGFLVRECLVDEVEFIANVCYEESVWMKVRGGRGRSALYIGCVYMPIDSTSAIGIDGCYERLKEDVLNFKEKGRVVLLGDFNARVGKSVEVDDVIGMFGEDTCNTSGNRLISFLNEVELVVCNGRNLVSEPEWTRVRPSLNQRSVIDYVITDVQLLAASGDVHIDNTDIGCSDHFLVWIELGRVTNRSKKEKRVIRRWRLDRLVDDEVKVKYQEALKAEVHNFSESIKHKIEMGMKGYDLVKGALDEWESIVNKVAKREIGDKVIMCGRSARWWDNEIKERISFRREVYRKVINGREDLWDEYCRIRKEVKELVREKKLNIWNEVVEKANIDFEDSRKEFWAFVSRRTRGKKKNIASLRNAEGVSVTSTKGKLEVLRKHYQRLGSISLDSDFNEDWKDEVESKVDACVRMSGSCEDAFLDKGIEKAEIAKCTRKLKNNKTGGSDGLVGELLKYGGSGMVCLLEQLFSIIWQEETVPRQWREGLIVNLFKKGDREDPGNYRGITLLSVVGKVFCKVLNNRLVQCLDKEGALHEGQAGFRVGRSCMDNVYSLNEIVQGRLREDKETYAFFLDVQKAYDTVWRDGLWVKLWEMGVKGKMWRVTKNMYEASRSAVLLEGEKSPAFSVEQGVAQGCSLSPILFSVFINDLLKDVEEAGLGIELSSGKMIGGMLFADDFVGITDSKESLQKLINVVHRYCNRWRLKANVGKSAVMVFSRNVVEGEWNWGEHQLPKVSNYCYLGIDFASNGAWDVHLKKVITNGRKKVNQLHSIISNRDINLSARRLLLLSVIRPSIEYGGEIWEGNKGQVAALESIILGGAKRILGCSSKTCNEAVRGDMGLETLKGRRDRAKLKWWYKLAAMPEDRYPKQLFKHEWEIKSRRGRQRKTWGRMIDDLFASLNLDKSEWLEDIRKGEGSLDSYLACVEESVSEREDGQFEKGLESKVKLDIYKRFGKGIEFKRYLHGVSDAGTRLLFKFRSGTHGLNEELGRHRGREGKSACTLCGAECESVVHVLWECSTYDSSRVIFVEHLRELLGDGYADFVTLNNVEKTAYVLGNENWGSNFSSLLALVKEYILEIWEERKQKIYGEDSCPCYSQFSAGDLTGQGTGKFGPGGTKGKLNVSLNMCMSGSAHNSGCVVNGSTAMAAN